MSLVFLCLKAMRIFETPTDFVFGAVLLNLDLLVLAEWLRLWWHRTGR